MTLVDKLIDKDDPQLILSTVPTIRIVGYLPIPYGYMPTDPEAGFQKG